MKQPADSNNVEVTQLGYVFAGREQPTLADISFTLAPGSWTLIAGCSGSGKSTLLRALVGLIPNQSAGEMLGHVRLFGLDTRGAAPAQLARRAGLVLQSPDDQICTPTVESEVAFGLENLALPPDEIGTRIEHWLARFGLSGCRHQSTQTLSGGQKQRLVLASVLAMGPRLLVFDEPLAQLDAAGAAELIDELELLREAGLTIVVAEHRLDELLPEVDQVLFLNQGHLTAPQQHVPSANRQLPLPPGEGWGEGNSARRENLSPTAPPPHPARDARHLLPAGEGVTKRPLPPSNLQSPIAPPNTRLPLPPGEGWGKGVLKVEHFGYSYPAQSRRVWSDVSFEVHAQERVAIVGPNGSGKTTLVSALARIVRPDQGKFWLPEATPGTTQLGLVPQNPDLALFCRTVHDELAFGPRQLRLPRAEIARRVAQAANAFDLVQLLEEAPLALSQGERLRVAVAAAATPGPRLLLLDEPTIGQDFEQMHRLLSALGALVATGEIGAVLFTSHDQRAIRAFATRVLIIAEGRLLADGSVDELFANTERLRRAGLLHAQAEGLATSLPSQLVDPPATSATARPQ